MALSWSGVFSLLLNLKARFYLVFLLLKNNYILSASLDKNVFLWNIEKEELVASFDHPNAVSSVIFHPIVSITFNLLILTFYTILYFYCFFIQKNKKIYKKESGFFVSGSYDKKIRVWDILEHKLLVLFIFLFLVLKNIFFSKKSGLLGSYAVGCDCNVVLVEWKRMLLRDVQWRVCCVRF